MSGEREVQVGWLGPYGIVPGGMDVDPAPHWRPVYVKVPDPVGTAAQTVQESEPEVRLTYREWLATQEWCPTCLSTGPRHPIPDFCPDPWHSTAGPSVLADTDQ